MPTPAPAETKLLLCVWHPFTLWRAPEWLPARLRERYPGMRVVHLTDYSRLMEELPDTNIFVGWSLRPQQFAAARKLEWLHSTAAGVAQLMHPGLRASGIAVTNASGVHAVPIGEHVLGLLLALARRFPSAFRHQAARHWGQQDIWNESVRPRELRGATILVVGLGAIGREVARLARGLGMRVTAVTRSGQDAAGVTDRVVPASALDALLPEADFVVLAAPETPETHQLMNARRFSRMKRGAYLVNVARGSLVEEPALVAALREQRIAGAALDVAGEEPLPESSPLWTVENCFLTPHLSGASDSMWERQAELLCDNLDRWFSGRELRNRVNLSRGY
ncbi:MAG TPA: D-2-hydroxyacid dehydrogenase [Candidatus Acidoferrales bacterium]|nr:D-2-hydroxyacid dehydrogenase [Candidatus Acidoferrales bacterium]